jgi:hypothetical protein
MINPVVRSMDEGEEKFTVSVLLFKSRLFASDSCPAPLPMEVLTNSFVLPPPFKPRLKKVVELVPPMV